MERAYIFLASPSWCMIIEGLELYYRHVCFFVISEGWAFYSNSIFQSLAMWVVIVLVYIYIYIYNLKYYWSKLLFGVATKMKRRKYYFSFMFEK